MYLYHFNFFFKKIEVSIEGEAFLKLMGSFGNRFAPTIINELSPDGKTSSRIRMIGLNDMDDFSVTFGNALISIQHKNEALLDASYKEIEDKMNFIIEVVYSLMENQKAMRIASLITKVDEVIHVDEPKIREKVLVGDIGKQAFEWNSRIVKQIEFGDEICNSVLSLNRGMMMIPDLNINQLTDILLIETDTNTVAENGSYRFTSEDTSLLKDLFNLSREKQLFLR